MKESKIVFVHSQRFSIDLSPIRPFMAVGTKRNEIFIFVTLAFTPRHDMMHFYVNVSTRHYGTSMAGFHEDFSAQL